MSAPSAPLVRTGLALGSVRPIGGVLTNRVLLIGIVALAAGLGLWRLDAEGFSNTYYAATVRSMLASWHAFFFASFDPGGFITVDKPPLGFWVQALSAAILGFSGVSLLLPEVIATALSVLVLNHLVARVFGARAGLVAAFALAVTPIAVATSRNSTVDSILVLVVLLGAWAVSIAAERGHIGWLVVAFALVGVGFNVKMLQAYLVAPAFGAAFLLAAPRSLRARIGGLALATLVLLAISASWALAVSAVPADQRPYVGGSTTNSEFELAINYNGLDRLNGGFGFPDTGAPGPLRLFGGSVAGQASWLIPFALVGLTAGWLVWLRELPLLAGPRRRRGGPGRGLGRSAADASRSAADSSRSAADSGRAAIAPDPLPQHSARAAVLADADRRRLVALVLWGVWLATVMVFFSVARFWHLYYLVMVGPAVAALVGIGAVLMAREYRHGSAIGMLLPGGLVLTGLVQLAMLQVSPEWADRLTPIVLTVSLGVGAILLLVRIAPDLFVASPRHRVTEGLVALGVAGLLVAPLAWSIVTVADAPGGTLPQAGPRSSPGFGFGRLGGFVGRGGGVGGGGSGLAVSNPMVTFLEANRGNARWIVATASAQVAAPIILATGQGVMALGGFTGGDPAISLPQFRSLVRAGAVRYVLVSGGGFGRLGGGDSGQILRWATNTCRPVSFANGGSTSAPGQFSGGSSIPGFGPFGGTSLVDCRGT
ncbi:MAG TPA: glycosyltransferase family 39 protein [Candidatus Saccharimonadales bacterium]|nr:glycosyltransferase family 39 protein [Candidatus Saccharimonadales bacterium]